MYDYDTAMIKALLPAALLMLGLTACNTVKRINDVSVGMTKAETIAALGNPDTTTSPGNGVEILKFKLRRTRPPLKVPVTEEFYVRLVKGRVDAFGRPSEIPPKVDNGVGTARLLNRVSLGMTKAEAIAALGEPHSTISPGNGVELLKYSLKNTLSSSPAAIEEEYQVRLVNGRVEAYGRPADIAAIQPVIVRSDDKVVNVNIRTDGSTNIAPVQPHINIKAN